jgi:hypothetical protein
MNTVWRCLPLFLALCTDLMAIGDELRDSTKLEWTR